MVESLTFGQMAERSKNAKAKRRECGTAKIEACGVPFTKTKTGGFSFQSPRGTYFPSTGRWVDFRADGMTVKCGSEKFVAWVKKNAGNDNALPPGTDENSKKKLGFGRHKGKRYSELESSYLRWMAETFEKNQFGSPDPRKQAAILELMRREALAAGVK